MNERTHYIAQIFCFETLEYITKHLNLVYNETKNILLKCIESIQRPCSERRGEGGEIE